MRREYSEYSVGHMLFVPEPPRTMQIQIYRIDMKFIRDIFGIKEHKDVIVTNLSEQMLSERTVKQHKGELTRRLYNNAYFDIFVWHDELDSIVKFQICYDIYYNERALTWDEGKGFKHDIIDDGGIDPTRNETPVLKEGGVFPLEDILERFVVSSEGIDPLVRTFIIDTLNTYRKYH